MRKLLPVILILLVATVAFAQNRSRIVGTVTTADGAVIPDVNVTITSDALIAREMSTTTNDRGMFRFVLLPIGTYKITFEKEGYSSIEQSELELGFDATLTLNKVLSPSDFEEVITITGEAPVVDKTSSSLGDKLDIEFLQNTPNTRDVWSMPNLSAGFTNNSSFGAVQDAGQAYNTDGINVSDPATGTVFSSISYTAVEQVDVAQFGAPAEYGAFTGASINVVTKSGGNEFSGEVSYFAQRVDWVSDNTEEYDSIGAPTASDDNDMEFGLGGPIVQDKIWFYVNYKHQNTDTQREIIDGTITQEETPRRPYIKLSARWDDRNISYFSFNHFTRDRSHRTYVGGWRANYEDSLWMQTTESDTYLLQHSFALSDNLIFEGRFAGFRGGFDLVPRMADGTNKPILYNYRDGVHLPGSSANRADLYERDRDNLLISANYFNDDWGGQHSFKFGFEYERSRSGRYITLNNFQYWWGPDLTYLKYDYGDWEGYTIVERFAGYAQDSWNVNDRLTINYGFRYDSSGIKADDPSIAPIGDETIMRFNDPAPRIGFAYDLFGDGTTVIRGFYGRYYEGVVTGNTESFVTEVPPTYEYYGQAILGADAPEWTLWNIYGGTGNIIVADDVDNQYSEGFTIGIERELYPNLAGGVSFIWRKDNNILGEISPDATWDTANASFSNENGSYNGVYYPNYNSGARVIYGNAKEGDVGVLAEPEREYMGVIFEITKRMSDNWSLRANYTYSKQEGNLGQGYGIIQGFSGWSNPNDWINAGGRLSLDRPHQLKLSGTYIAPFDIFISPTFTFYSGTPWTPWVTIDDADINIEETTGDRRFDDQANIDLRLEKAFIFQDRYRIGVIFDVFNLMNDDAVTGFSSTNITSSNYMVPDSIVGARFYQVGVRLIF